MTDTRFSYERLGYTETTCDRCGGTILPSEPRVETDDGIVCGPGMSCEIFVPIANVDEWEVWWDANCVAMEGEYEIDHDTAFDLACNQALVIGGGAAPLFRIGFVD